MVNNMNLKKIEFWEYEYLKQLHFLLSIDYDKMMKYFETKEEIRNDWEQYLGKETSDFATGSERIFYWLFNQIGKPNSSPIGSDLFFETYNAYIHIDVKTVTLNNIGNGNTSIFVGNNQNSYKGKITNTDREYKGNLPTIYTKNDGTKKVCLTYFIVIIHDSMFSNINAMYITCMPNGELSPIYGSKPLKAGKNKDKILFNFISTKYFDLLENKPYRTKVLLFNPENDKIRKKLKEIEEIYLSQQ